VHHGVERDPVLKVRELRARGVEPEHHPVHAPDKRAHVIIVLRRPRDVSLRALRPSFERHALPHELHRDRVVGVVQAEHAVEHAREVRQVFKARDQGDGQDKKIDWQRAREQRPRGKEVAVDFELRSDNARAELRVQDLQRLVDRLRVVTVHLFVERLRGYMQGVALHSVESCSRRLHVLEASNVFFVPPALPLGCFRWLFGFQILCTFPIFRGGATRPERGVFPRQNKPPTAKLTHLSEATDGHRQHLEQWQQGAH
jgi:hypothetical protein